MTQPTLVEAKGRRFVISEAPTDDTLKSFISFMTKAKVTDVVRVCEETYNPAELISTGIKFHDFPFPDGDSPPTNIIQNWLKIVEQEVLKGGNTVAIHCVAGLGRAPVLVAIALIEFLGMEPLDAVTYIRKRRRGAINATQLKFLQQYKPMRKKGGCIVM
eukprot:CAMPEP_0113866798 /NCGR_PEP_ID=MMETSP0780_2-20120614/67_1 /TAXON_ID=652834 /ORGANISM="Palpitomonas bilix" /LENGTH=159 /DNA_ID=CAMNT_0000851677 /DNA_START=228 /DNA_END=707 /DNA_ORIENTATION=+ /assembly_acc=CAM_ASM_000599